MFQALISEVSGAEVDLGLELETLNFELYLDIIMLLF